MDLQVVRLQAVRPAYDTAWILQHALVDGRRWKEHDITKLLDNLSPSAAAFQSLRPRLRAVVEGRYYPEMVMV